MRRVGIAVVALALAARPAMSQPTDEQREADFRRRAREALLRDSMPHALSSTRLGVLLANRVSAFRIESVVATIDGELVLRRGGVVEEEQVSLFDGTIVPGDHELAVDVTLRGRGFGIFTYLHGYRMRLQGGRRFTTREGTDQQVRVVAFERGSPTVTWCERPQLRFSVAE